MGNNLQKHHSEQNQHRPELQAVTTEPPDEYFTCQICIEPMLLPNKKFNNQNHCIHPFCTDCIVKYITVKLDDSISDIPCPALNCEQILDPISCQNIVGPQLFVKWCDGLCEAAVLGLDQCYCPNQNCSALILDECCGGNAKRSQCPNCKSFFCFKCKLPWHAGFRCEESRESRDSNDVAFGVLAERNKWMRCPHCCRFVERIAGCNSVKCRCGAFFCYKCGMRNGCNCDRVHNLCLTSLGCFMLLLIPIWGLFYLLYRLWDRYRSEK